jgi:cellobiose phosphorylase
VQPRVPASWPELAIDYRFGQSLYHVVVRMPGLVRPGAAVITVNGERIEGQDIPLRDDGQTHHVLVAPREAGATEVQRTVES